jgi:hypothetical protein
LHLAAYHGAADAVKLLLQHGADVNATDQRRELPIHKVIQNEADQETVEELLQNGSRVDVYNSEGVTPVRLAALRGKGEVYELLLKAAGGVEPPGSKGAPPGADQPNKTAAELIDDLASRDSNVRSLAEQAIIARGGAIMPEVLRAIDQGTDVALFYGAFEKMGPEASAVLPKLESMLTDKKRVFMVMRAMDVIRPGSVAGLSANSRQKAAGALSEAAVDPEGGEMRGINLEMLAQRGKWRRPICFDCCVQAIRRRVPWPQVSSSNSIFMTPHWKRSSLRAC